MTAAAPATITRNEASPRAQALLVQRLLTLGCARPLGGRTHYVKEIGIFTSGLPSSLIL